MPLDVLLETAFDELHRRLGWDLHRVLLITELDTAFGQSIRQRDVLEYFRAIEPVFLAQHVDNLGVGFASEHAHAVAF